MKKFFLLLIIPINFLFAQQKDYKAQSEKILQQIQNREFSKVTELFDSVLSKRMDTTRIKTQWDKLIMITGPFVKVNKVSTDTLKDNITVIQNLQFEKRKIDFRIVYGPNGKIRGLSFLPESTFEKYKLPDYYKPELIRERNLAIQDGPFRLPGMITRPNKEGKFPLVILIHGIGPNDKDETIGSMKIFKDLAIGLASQGVAVYRYEKRTRVYKMETALNSNMTVDDETIYDVVSAVNLLKSDSTIDSTAIYLCGHGMGGMLLPRIGKLLPKIKGLIYLGANARPLEDIIYEQTAYVMNYDTLIKDHTAYLDSMKREANKIKMLKSTDKDSIKIFNFPPAYWIDMNNYNPVKSASQLKTPMFFIFGERDYQVTQADIDLWKKGLGNLPHIKFKIYPKLNHFFIAGEGKSVPAEYSKVSNVDFGMIQDISDWILAPGKK